MGAWGCESSSNDNTMDILCECCEGTQEEADQCLQNEFDTEHYSTSLGLVVWFLQAGLKVNSYYLQESLGVIEKELADNGETSGWFEFEERKNCLLAEKQMIESAFCSYLTKLAILS